MDHIASSLNDHALNAAPQYLCDKNSEAFHKQLAEYTTYDYLDTESIIEFMAIGDYDKFPDIMCPKGQTNLAAQTEEESEEIFHLLGLNMGTQEEEQINIHEQVSNITSSSPEPSCSKKRQGRLKEGNITPKKSNSPLKTQTRFMS